MDRRHAACCAAIWLETAVCFAVPVFLLLYGLVLLPFSALGMSRAPARFWPLVVLPLLGAAGMAGVVRVLILLCRRQHDPQRAMTLSALVCGAAAVLFYASIIGTRTSPTPPLLVVTIVVLPVLCTLHLVYLGRRVLLT